MHGEMDSIVPFEYSQKADKAYYNSRLELFMWEGHGFSDDADKHMLQMLIKFIKDIVF